MGKACSRNGVVVKRIQNFSAQTSKKREPYESSRRTFEDNIKRDLRSID